MNRNQHREQEHLHKGGHRALSLAQPRMTELNRAAPLLGMLLGALLAILVGPGFLFASAQARTQERPTVQNAQCLLPRNNPLAPVGIIYLHGWFPATGTSGYYIDLEKANRAQLQQLADTLGVRIAVPVSDQIHANGNRSWGSSMVPGTAQNRLRQIESRARAACGGAALGSPRSLIGFSDGGYMAREIALQCAAKRSEYTAIMMVGARARVAASDFRDCAPLLAIRGTSDFSTDAPNAPFSQTADRMLETFRRGGGSGDLLAPYPGGHILPPNDILARHLSSPQAASLPSHTPAPAPRTVK
jgi:poly(3-hydroxybutyrate) depolymerase